jgi:hypothetical protein
MSIRLDVPEIGEYPYTSTEAAQAPSERRKFKNGDKKWQT